MNYIQNLFNKYQSFVLGKIPHKVKNSQIFFLGLMLLALPITIALVNTQQDVRERAQELATPPIPPNPTISGYVYYDNDANGVRGNLEGGIANVKIAIYKLNTCPTPTFPGSSTTCTTSPIENFLYTDSDGKFIFLTDGSGEYSVRVMDEISSLLVPTNSPYAVVTVPPDQTVYFGYAKTPISPTPTISLPTPTIVPPTPTPTQCIHPTLKNIDFGKSCRMLSPIPPFFKKGYKVATFTCSDGFRGTVGNSLSCSTKSVLINYAVQQCENRCILTPTSSFSKVDLNLDGYINNMDYFILTTCIAKRSKCNAKQNPDINADGKVNNTDLLLIKQSIMRVSP